MRFILLLLLLVIYSTVSSQEERVMSLFDTLYTAEKIEITLTYPFDSLYKSNNDEIDALISIKTNEVYLMQDVSMSLNLRGKFRRMKCTMPPLLLNFKKSTLKELHLAPFDEIKLVTHCMEGPEGQENLSEELLIYQLYETLTPLSYRTIWVNVRYCNSLKSGDCITSVGFLLEPDKVITSRLGIAEKKLFNLAEDSIHYETYGLTAAFNFLVGNRDWSIISSRNAKLFYEPGIGKYVVIPYDFDYSNIVGASYRRESLPATMTHPFDRIYAGEYFNSKSGDILKTFYGFEKPIFDAVNNCHNPMTMERRRNISKYFESWFNMVKRKKTNELEYGLVCPYLGGL